MEGEVQKAIWVRHIHLQPVDRCVQLHLYTLTHDTHFRFRNFDLFVVYVLAEQGWKLIEEHLTDS
jgi:hypothetical protein